jgi:hypothetical protein
MNNTMAFLLGGLLLFAWASLLLAFKLLCLDKIKCHFGRYSLGMLFAYGLLLLLYVASEHYPPLKALLLSWYIKGIPGGIILMLVPSIYSIFLIGKGYIQEGGKKASFKWKLKMMASVFFNAFLALFVLVFFSFLRKGGTFSELATLIQASARSIPLGWLLAFVACWGLIVLIVWLDHKKSSSKPKPKK